MLRGPIPKRKPKLPLVQPAWQAAPHPVLASLSERYPGLWGRLPTCYSPVRRSSTPEGAFPLDLHVLSTPPAFVLSQDQTLRDNLVHATRGSRYKRWKSLCSQRRGRICLVVVRSFAGPKAGRAAMLEPHDGVLFMGLLAPCGASGALTSAGQTRESGPNRLPRCSVFKDRVPRGHWLTLDTNMAPGAGAFCRRSPQWLRHGCEIRYRSTPTFWVMTASGQSPCVGLHRLYADFRAVSRARTPLVFMPESDKSGLPWGLEEYTRRFPSVNLISCRS